MFNENLILKLINIATYSISRVGGGVASGIVGGGSPSFFDFGSFCWRGFPLRTFSSTSLTEPVVVLTWRKGGGGEGGKNIREKW